jgi:hypothetical protein
VKNLKADVIAPDAAKPEGLKIQIQTYETKQYVLCQFQLNASTELLL